MKGLNGTPRGMVDEDGGCAGFGDFFCGRGVSAVTHELASLRQMLHG